MVGLGAALRRGTEGWRMAEEETRALQDRDRAIAERELRLQGLRDQMSSQQEMRPLQMEQARLNLGEARRRNTLGGIEDEYRLEAMPEIYALEGRKRTSLGKTLDAQENARTVYGKTPGALGRYGAINPEGGAQWELRDEQLKRELDRRIREARNANERNRAIQDKQTWTKLATMPDIKMPKNLEEYSMGRQDALSRMRELADKATEEQLTPQELDEYQSYQQGEREYKTFLERAGRHSSRREAAQQRLLDMYGIDDYQEPMDGGEEDPMAFLDDPDAFSPAPAPAQRPRNPALPRMRGGASSDW